MSLWHRLLAILGLRLPPAPPDEPATPALPFDGELLQSLQELAASEQRPEHEVAVELIYAALNQRQVEDARAHDLLRTWRTLSLREQQVVSLVCRNYTNRQIAEILVLSPATVKSHVRNALIKFSLQRRTDLQILFSGWEFKDG